MDSALTLLVLLPDLVKYTKNVKIYIGTEAYCALKKNFKKVLVKECTASSLGCEQSWWSEV